MDRAPKPVPRFSHAVTPLSVLKHNVHKQSHTKTLRDSKNVRHEPYKKQLPHKTLPPPKQNKQNYKQKETQLLVDPQTTSADTIDLIKVEHAGTDSVEQISKTPATIAESVFANFDIKHTSSRVSAAPKASMASFSESAVTSNETSENPFIGGDFDIYPNRTDVENIQPINGAEAFDSVTEVSVVDPVVVKTELTAETDAEMDLEITAVEPGNIESLIDNVINSTHTNSGVAVRDAVMENDSKGCYGEYLSYTVKLLKIWTPPKIAVIILKLGEFCFTTG